MERVTERVQKWFIDDAKKYKWDEPHFAGNECLLKVNCERREIPQDSE